MTESISKYYKTIYGALKAVYALELKLAFECEITTSDKQNVKEEVTNALNNFILKGKDYNNNGFPFILGNEDTNYTIWYELQNNDGFGYYLYCEYEVEDTEVEDTEVEDTEVAHEATSKKHNDYTRVYADLNKELVNDFKCVLYNNNETIASVLIYIYLNEGMKMYFNLKKIIDNPKHKDTKIFIICGNRSIGKTYSFKEWAIRDYLSNKNECMYVRRIKDEFGHISTFWDDITDKFNVEIKSLNRQFFIRSKGSDEPYEVFGHYVPLSEQQNYKGAVFNKVNKICFDEFIIENHRRHYINDEVQHLESLISTVTRQRDNVRTLLFSNAGSILNPYFLEYNIAYKELLSNKSIYKLNKKIYVTCINMDMNIDDSYYSKKYKEYAFNNLFNDAISDDIINTPKQLLPRTVYEYNDKLFLISIEKKSCHYFIETISEERSNKLNIRKLSNKSRNMRFEYSINYNKLLKSIYYSNNMRFKDPETRTQFLAIFI